MKLHARILAALVALAALCSLASAQWQAHTDGRLVHPDGSAEVWKNPLAAGLSFAQPGEYIEVHGDLYGSGACRTLTFGEKPSFYGGNYPHPQHGNEIHGITIRGIGDNAQIGTVQVSQRMYSTHDLRWEGITVNGEENVHCWIFFQGQEHVGFEFYSCTANAGTGKPKWGWRAHGPPRDFLWQDCVAADMFEHGIYWDNARGSATVRNCTFLRCKRTGIQCTNREDSGASGDGLVLIDGNKIIDCGEHGGGGITIAGHLGPVTIKRNEVVSPFDTYAVVVWGEGGNPKVGKIGAWKDPGGYAVSYVQVEPRQQFSVPNTKRGCVSISSSREAWVGHSVFDGGGKADVTFYSQYGGGPNGEARLYAKDPASWSGWSGAGPKVVEGPNSKVLSDAEINGMGLDRPAGTTK